MISVIIPIYNVEAYLPGCLDSLAAQTFADVEFILVDDGSTDRSGEIADSYQDSRFRVYHTSNRGLSAARNLGVKKARGEWLMFVDSDDRVSPDFCRIPYKAAVEYDAGLVIFKFANSRSQTFRGVVDAETALKYGDVVVWNKLYKRELFETIRYPEGRVFEDRATTHKLIFAAKRIVMLPDVLYYHLCRKDSISHVRSEKYKRDAFLSALERLEDLRSYGCAEVTFQTAPLSAALTFLAVSDSSDDPLYQKAEEIVDSEQGGSSGLNWKKKIMLLVWKTDKRLFHLICRILRQKDDGRK